MMPVPAGTTRTVNANILGTRRLVKTGEGTLILNGDNTVNAGIEIQGGCLQVSNTRNLGTQPTTADANFITIRNQGCLRANHNNSKVILNQHSGITIQGNTTIESNNGTLDILSPIVRTAASDTLVLQTSDDAPNGTVRIRSRLDQNNLVNHTFDVTVRRKMTLDVNDTVAPFNNVVIPGNVTSEGDVRGKGKINGNLIFNNFGRLLPGAELSTTLHIGGDLELIDSSETYISITQGGNDNLVVDGDVILDGRLLLIPFQGNLPTFNRPLITLSRESRGVNSENTITDNGWRVINYRDNFPNNGINLPNNSDYPTVSITTGTNGNVRLIKS